MCSLSTIQHNFYFFEFRKLQFWHMFENRIFFENGKRYWKILNGTIVCSASTIQHNFNFFEIRKLQSCHTFENIDYFENGTWYRKKFNGTIEHKLSFIQHNFHFFEIRILQFCEIFSKKNVFSNIFLSFSNFEKKITAQFGTNLAQFSTTFIFSKFENCNSNVRYGNFFMVLPALEAGNYNFLFLC